MDPPESLRAKLPVLLLSTGSGTNEPQQAGVLGLEGTILFELLYGWSHV